MADPLCVGGPFSVKSEAVTYPDILLYWGCESTTIDKSGGDTTATLTGGGAAINTDIKAVGSASLDCPTSYDRAQIDYSTGVINLNEGRIGFYVYWDTLGASEGLFTMSYDANNTIQLYASGAGAELTMLVKTAGTGGTLATSGAGLTTLSWFFIEFAWKLSTDYKQVFVNGTSKAISNSDIGAGWAGNPTIMTFGEWAGVTNDMHMDQIMISNDSTRNLYALRNNTSF